jgi:putative hemolysin
MIQPAKEPLIRLPSPFKDPFRHRLFSVVGGAIERILAIDQINDIYASAAAAQGDRPFSDRLLDVLNIVYRVSDEDLSRIPKTGPAVVVANHPFGGIEGIILCSMLRSVRPDAKLMANYLLQRIPDMRDLFIFVDPFGGDSSTRANIRPMKEALQFLRGGGLLGIFPSGEVSHLNLSRGGISDPEWNPTVARLVRKTKAPVVPVFFRGINSALFQVLGIVHPRLRTAMLPHEVVNKRRRTIDVRVGNPVPFDRLEPLADDAALMNYLRVRTYHLVNRQAAGRRRRIFSFPVRFIKGEPEPVAPALNPAQVEAEVERLPASQVLIEQGDYVVAYTRADQSPAILRELGRLRELSFREVGEGTGKASDVDAFDAYYLHLFVWNRPKRELVGAYRLGQTDVILEQRGLRGLYTSTLFRYRRKLLDRISPALEMGRSFVRTEYQRSFSALLLLWKGLGLFVCRHPKYKVLFGPVSINNEYQTSSRLLLAAFLSVSNFLPDLARLVKARKPLRANPVAAWRLRRTHAIVDSLDEVETLIADIETDLKGIPILLKQYLKLGGKLLGFNIDPDFGNVLDGLILVDLTQTDRAILNKYMGRENAVKFLAHHGISALAPVGDPNAGTVKHVR